jgi:hypothetical protein
MCRSVEGMGRLHRHIELLHTDTGAKKWGEKFSRHFSNRHSVFVHDLVGPNHALGRRRRHA